MLKRICAIGLSAIAFGSLAFVDATTSEALAGEEGQVSTDYCEGKKQLSYEELQEACEHPLMAGNQRKPYVIDILCERTARIWKEKPDFVKVPVDKHSTFRATLKSDKGCTPDEDDLRRETPIEVMLPCKQFVEMELTYSRTASVSCDDVLANSNVIQMCESTLKRTRGVETVIKTEATGRVFNNCSAVNPEKAQL
ncbi:hypothetical protein [Polyangium sorediatum]|uniref:Secreted protein n=1 Tax=Polyangium sorediatum TaxID=889274 RepID=A0ABT6P4F7_9BACT|nr:hypothetical protein [Polyangium sorediatum]MDI1435495.1 hypothetical protein [Polyangium sorediatum]